MTTATATPPPQSPPTPPPASVTRMTAEEFGVKHAGDHVEYINGEVKEMPMPGFTHGKVCWKIAKVLGNYIDLNDLGHFCINDTFVRVSIPSDPERVYGPDVCFVSFDRLAKDVEVADGVLNVLPNLVVEVRSPSDTWTDVLGKMLDYLRVGVPVVLILDPHTRSASVFRNEVRQEIFEAETELRLPDVLPGFAVSVASLFA